MTNFLEQEEINNLNQNLKTVKDDPYLTESVYLMKVEDLQPGTDKREQKYLRLIVNTGYQTKEGGPRMLNKLFYTAGEYPDGKKKIEELARLLKKCFKLKEVSNENLKMIIGREFSVATKKDKDGFIDIWYYGHQEELKEMKANYKKKEQNENKPAPATNTAEGSGPADDDLPF